MRLYLIPDINIFILLVLPVKSPLTECTGLQSLFRKNKLFVHFVLDPIAVSDTSGELSFAARHGCLVLIENVSLKNLYIFLFNVNT